MGRKASESVVQGVDKFAALPISEKAHLIDEWICSDRDRYILKRKLLDGWTFAKLEEDLAENADFIPVSGRHLWTLVEKGKKILLQHIKGS